MLGSQLTKSAKPYFHFYFNLKEIGIIMCFIFHLIELDSERKLILRYFFSVTYKSEFFHRSVMCLHAHNISGCLGSFPEKPSLRKSQASKNKMSPPIISLVFQKDHLPYQKDTCTKGNKYNPNIRKVEST